MASIISNPTAITPSIPSLSPTHSLHTTYKPKPTTPFPSSSFFNPISLSPHRPKPSTWRTQRFSISCGGGVTEIDQTQFPDTVLKSPVPVLVEFTADWCGPCRLIAPAMEWASQEYADRLKIVKIDHDANPQLIEEYKIYGLPGLIVFSNGVEVQGSRREGPMTKVKLKHYLDAILDSIAVA